jgi:MHS family proline/betaine transporter-like MFS transporter
VPEHKRGFFGNIALTGVGLGLILSACTIFIVESLVTEETLYAYAWRIPFFISVIASLFAYYIRRNLLETIDFSLVKESGDIVANPLKEMFKNYKLTILRLFAIFLTTQVAFFIVFIYSKSMMIDFLHFDHYTAGKFNLCTVVSYTLSTLVFGYLSDKINKRYLILLGIMGIFCTALPFINFLKDGNPVNILFICLTLGALIGIAEGTLNPLVAESFPTNIRTTSVSFCWNFTAIMFGGTAPLISIWLIEKTGTVDILAYYLMGVAAVSRVSLMFSLGLQYRKQTIRNLI